MELSYDDLRWLARLKAEEKPGEVREALDGRQAAYEAVLADEELFGVFESSVDEEQQLVILKDTAAEGTGCRVALTLYHGELALIKEVMDPAAFQTELLRHKEADSCIKTALLCYSMRCQFLVTELGPRQDLLREMIRLVESDTPTPDIARQLIGWVHDLVKLLNIMSREGSAHVDLKWEKLLHLALIDFASSLKHGGRVTVVDPSRVASTCNHCPPELLLGELHPTNDMHAVGFMIQALILGPVTCVQLALPTLHISDALLHALASGELMETAWAQSCGLRPNVVALLVLLQAVLVAPPARQPSWSFVEGMCRRLVALVDSMEAAEDTVQHRVVGMMAEMQLLLLLSSATEDESGFPIGPKACLLPDTLDAVRARYAAIWEGYAAAKKLDNVLMTVWRKEFDAPDFKGLPPEPALIDADDEDALDAHFAPLPPPFAPLRKEHKARKEQALELTSSVLCPKGYDMTHYLPLLDPEASEDTVLQRLSIAQQCFHGWNDYDNDYFEEYLQPFLPEVSESGAEGSNGSTQNIEAVTLGFSRLEIAITRRGGHALRAAARRKDAAEPTSSAAQRGIAPQRGRQRDRRRQQAVTAAAEGKQGGGGGGEASNENVDSNAAGGMPPPPPRVPAARRRAAPPAEQQAAAGKSRAGAEDAVAGAAASSAQAQQVKDWVRQMAAIGQLPTTMAASRSSNQRREGTALWQCGKPKGRSWTRGPSTADDMNRMLMLTGNWRSEYDVLSKLLAKYQGMEPLAHSAGTAYIMLTPLQLSGGLLPAALEAELVQAGLLVEQEAGGLKLVIGALPFTIVFKCTRASQKCKWSKSEWTNEGLRKGLGLLGMRPAASEDDEGCGPAASRDGQRVVLTELGASLWHHVMRHLLSSKAAAAQIPAYVSMQLPPNDGATAEWHGESAPRLNPA